MVAAAGRQLRTEQKELPQVRFMGLLKADKESEAGAPPSKELMERMGKFVEEITRAGVLLATDGLSQARRARASGSPRGRSP